MRPATLFYALALFASAVFPVTFAAPSGDGALAARGPSPVIEERAPVPQPSHTRRGLRKRTQRVLTEEERISRFLCPSPLSLCPITEESRPTTLHEWTREGYECVNVQEDLYSCGSCGTVDTTHDCTSIEGALNVACVVGSCRVDSCRPEYYLSLDRKTCIPRY